MPTAIKEEQIMVSDKLAVIRGIEKSLEALPENLQWNNFYIKAQIDRRENGERFDLQDHIRAMVYSLLSSQTPWIRIETNKSDIDAIFCDYIPDQLAMKDPILINEQLKEIKCGSLNRKSQMQALTGNIEKMVMLNNQAGGIDAFYDGLLTKTEDTHPFEKLIRLLAFDKKYKLKQMGVPLVAEYLRNVGYDIPKPDRHIMRILGPEHLNEHNRTAPSSEGWEPDDLFEAFRIIQDYSKTTGVRQAYIDYLLWSYCADGYGQICTKDNPKCNQCQVKQFCTRGSAQ